DPGRGRGTAFTLVVVSGDVRAPAVDGVARPVVAQEDVAVGARFAQPVVQVVLAVRRRVVDAAGRTGSGDRRLDSLVPGDARRLVEDRVVVLAAAARVGRGAGAEQVGVRPNAVTDHRHRLLAERERDAAMLRERLVAPHVADL